MTALEKRNKLAWILDALSLAAVLQYAAFRFLQSTMFVFYYSNTYKMITMGLLIVFGGIRYLYIVWGKLKQSEDKKKYILSSIGAWLLALPFFYVGWKQDYKFLIFLPICCMCLYDLQAEKVLKAFFVTIGTLLLATVLCSLSGTVRNLTGTGDDGRVVAAYGVINTTDFASYFTFLLLAIWCGMKGKRWASSILFAIFVTAICYLAYVLTDSRTVIETGAILLILVLWDCVVENRKELQKISKIVNALSIIAFPVIGIVIIILVYGYAQQAPWAVQIDQILSGRLRVTLDPYNTYGINPFGNLIGNIHGKGGTLLSYGWSSGYGYIDIGYAMLAIKYGWVITTVVTAFWIWMTIKAVKQGNRRIAFAMAIMAVHAFSEARVLDINYNIFLVMPFCLFGRGTERKETIKTRETEWVPVVLGMALVGAFFLLLPHILSWLRTLFAGKNWNAGTAAFNSLTVCAGVVTCIGLIWFFLNRTINGSSKRAAIGIVVVICICAVGVIVANTEISNQLTAAAERLDREERVIQSVQTAATQPIYVAEQEELYKRRFGGFDTHVFSSEEVRRGSIFTDSDVEELGIVSAGGMYTVVSGNTGLYSFDPVVINKLANEGYNWTPYYSGRRIINLSDFALFNGMRLSGGSLELVGPCRLVTTNTEIDQYGGTYEVEFKLSGLEGNGEIGSLEVLGDAGERLIKKETIIASDDGRREQTIKYIIGSVPKVSYGIEVSRGAKITVEEIGWKGIYWGIELSSGVEIQPDGRIIMTTNVPDNRFNMIHFQLYSIAGEYLASFGEGYAAGTVSGEYDLPSGYYYLHFKGNTNRSDEWVKKKIYIEKGENIHFSYTLEELNENHIIVRDAVVNDVLVASILES